MYLSIMMHCFRMTSRCRAATMVFGQEYPRKCYSSWRGKISIPIIIQSTVL